MDTNRICFNCFGELPPGHSGPCPVCGYQLPQGANPPQHLRCGSVLYGKYLIGRTLGQGGFGITYMGWDLNLDMKVAVKEYYPEGSVTRDQTLASAVIPFSGQNGDTFLLGREKFISEARTLAKFSTQPGVVNVRDFFETNGTAYIVMEYLEGETLRDMCQRRGRIPSVEVLALLRPLMTTLSRVHAAGLLHRDISPDNIMVLPDGTAKLLDFGAARQMSVQGEHSNTINVKHGYAPEEQYRTRGEQGPWTDIYALCATIYKLATGEIPPQVIDRLAGEQLIPPNNLGAQFSPSQQAALMRGLSIRGADRQQSMDALISELYAPVQRQEYAQVPAQRQEYIQPPVQRQEYAQAPASYNIPTPAAVPPVPPRPVSQQPAPPLSGGSTAYIPPAPGPVSFAAPAKKKLSVGLITIIALAFVAVAATVLIIVLSGQNKSGGGSAALPTIALPSPSAVAVTPAPPAATAVPTPTAPAETPAPVFTAGTLLMPDPGDFLTSELTATDWNGEDAYTFYADGSDMADYLSMLMQNPDFEVDIDGTDGEKGEVFLFRVAEGSTAAEFYLLDSIGKYMVTGLAGSSLDFYSPGVTAYWLNCNGITYDRWLKLGDSYGTQNKNYSGMPCCNMFQFSTATTQGDTIYYTDITDGAIYAVSLSSGDEEAVSYEGEYAYGLNVVDEMLYFFCQTTDDQYQIRYIDLSAPMAYSTLLISDAINCLVIGDYMYYVNYLTESLHKFQLSTEEDYVLLVDQNSGSAYAVDDDCLVYVDTNGDLCRTDLEGYHKEVLKSVGTGVLEIFKWGEWVYYEDPGSGYIMRYSLYIDATQSIFDPGSIDAQGNYYVAYDDKYIFIISRDDSKLYRYNFISGESEEMYNDVFYPFVLTDKGAPMLGILGDEDDTLYIFYPDESAAYYLNVHKPESNT